MINRSKGLTLSQSIVIATCAAVAVGGLSYWYTQLHNLEYFGGKNLLLGVLPNLIAAIVVASVGFFIFDRVSKKSEWNLSEDITNILVKLQKIADSIRSSQSLHVKEIMRMEEIIKLKKATPLNKASAFTTRFRLDLKKFSSSIHVIPLTESSMDYYSRIPLYKDKQMWGDENTRRIRVIFIEQSGFLYNPDVKDEVKALLQFLNEIGDLYVVNKALVRGNEFYGLYKDLGIFTNSDGSPSIGYATFVSQLGEEHFTKSPGVVHQIEHAEYLVEIVDKFRSFLQLPTTKMAILDINDEIEKHLGIKLNQTTSLQD